MDSTSNSSTSTGSTTPPPTTSTTPTTTPTPPPTTPPPSSGSDSGSGSGSDSGSGSGSGSTSHSSTTTPPPNTSTDETKTTSGTTSLTTFPNGSISSVIVTTFITTEAGGAIETITTFVPAPTSQPVSTVADHTAAIVGGSVGGVLAVAILLLVFFLVARHRKAARHRAFDNDIFNPDHTTRGPNFDLGAAQDDTVPVPYSYDPTEMTQSGAGSGVLPGMHAAGPGYEGHDFLGPAVAGAAVGAVGAAAYNHHSDRTSSSGMGRSPSNTSHTSSGARLAAVAGRTSPTSTTTSFHPAPALASASAGRSAKEREAFARTRARERESMSTALSAYGGVLSPPPPPVSPTSTGQQTSRPYSRGSLNVMNGNEFGALPNPYGRPDSTDPNRSMSPTSLRSPTSMSPEDEQRLSHSGGVVVHQDAGRVRDQDDEREIPPTYDSIPRDPSGGETGLGHGQQSRPTSSEMGPQAQ